MSSSAGQRAGRTSNSIMSTPASSAASNDSRVLPGAIRSAPLWPTRLSADIRGTRRSCGCPPTGRAPRSACRSAGTGGRRGCRSAGRASCGRVRADSCMRGRAASTIATASASVTSPVRRQGSISRDPARLGLPQVADAGDGPLLEHGVADRARRVVLAQAAEEALVVELGGEDVGAEAGDPLVDAGARVGHQLEHGSLELDDRLCRSRRITSQAAREGRRSASSTRHEPVMRRCEWIVSPPSKRRKRCLPWASTERTAWPASRSGQRSRAEARVQRLERVGHVALEHGPDAVRGVVDRVALGHAVQPRSRSTIARTRGNERGWRRDGVSAAVWRSGSSGTPSFAAGSPASANSRWSELPVPESAHPADGAAAGLDDPALDAAAGRARGRAEVERRARARPRRG